MEPSNDRMARKVDKMLKVTGRLRKLGIPFEQPDRWVIRFSHIEPMIDYWPTTNKYRWVTGTKKANFTSLENIIKKVRKCEINSPRISTQKLNSQKHVGSGPAKSRRMDTGERGTKASVQRPTVLRTQSSSAGILKAVSLTIAVVSLIVLILHTLPL